MKRDFGPAYNIAVHFVLDYVKFRLCETKNGLPSCSHNWETTVTRFMVEAYGSMEDTVIRNCWRTTKILPDFDDQQQEDTERIGLVDEIARLNLPDPLSEQEYINVVGEEQVTASDLIEDIISSVGQEEDCEADLYEAVITVKYHDAMKVISVFRTWMEQSEVDCTQEMNLICI